MLVAWYSLKISLHENVGYPVKLKYTLVSDILDQAFKWSSIKGIMQTTFILVQLQLLNYPLLQLGWIFHFNLHLLQPLVALPLHLYPLDIPIMCLFRLINFISHTAKLSSLVKRKRWNNLNINFSDYVLSTYLCVQQFIGNVLTFLSISSMLVSYLSP